MQHLDIKNNNKPKGGGDSSALYKSSQRCCPLFHSLELTGLIKHGDSCGGSSPSWLQFQFRPLSSRLVSFRCQERVNLTRAVSSEVSCLTPDPCKRKSRDTLLPVRSFGAVRFRFRGNEGGCVVWQQRVLMALLATVASLWSGGGNKHPRASRRCGGQCRGSNCGVMATRVRILSGCSFCLERTACAGPTIQPTIFMLVLLNRQSNGKTFF